MFNKFKNLLNKNFIKNVLFIVSGTAMAQLITLLLLPIITRLYGPEAYGVLGSFIAAINIFTPVAALTLPIAIVLPKNDVEAYSIIKASLKLVFLIFIILFVAISLLKDTIIDIFNVEEIGNYLILIPVAVFFAGLSQIMRQWLIRKNTFNVVATATVYQALFSHGGIVLIGFVYPLVSVLIVLTVLKNGLLALLIYLNIRIKNKELQFELSETSLTFRNVLNKYYDFPRYRMPESLMSTISQQLPTLLLLALSSPANAGFFTLARSSLLMPVKLLGNSVGDVFYPRIARAKESGENLSRLILKATLSLVYIGFLPFSVLIIFGPTIFSLIFGESWYIAGEYSRWISLLAFGMLISRPAVKCLPVLNYQKFHLKFTIITLFIRTCGLVFGLVVLNADVFAIAIFSITSFLLYLIIIILIFIRSKKFSSNK